MSGPGKDRVTVGVGLSTEAVRLLDAVAEESGMKRSTLVAALIEELAPKLERVTPRRGVHIELKRQAAEPTGASPASPAGRSVAAAALRASSA